MEIWSSQSLGFDILHIKMKLVILILYCLKNFQIALFILHKPLEKNSKCVRIKAIFGIVNQGFFLCLQKIRFDTEHFAAIMQKTIKWKWVLWRWYDILPLNSENGTWCHSAWLIACLTSCLFISWSISPTRITAFLLDKLFDSLAFSFTLDPAYLDF